MCVAQAVSVDLKVPWGARSRGGTGEEKQVKGVSHGSNCLGYGNKVKCFFPDFDYLKSELKLDCITTLIGSLLFIEHIPL